MLIDMSSRSLWHLSWRRARVKCPSRAEILQIVRFFQSEVPKKRSRGAVWFKAHPQVATTARQGQNRARFLKLWSGGFFARRLMVTSLDIFVHGSNCTGIYARDRHRVLADYRRHP
jgi:hypothetical protein